MNRPDRDEWHLDGADWLARMGDCTRRKVGALIVGPDKRFWGMGYNGSYPGGPSCLEGDCPRGRHYRVSDKNCWEEFCDDGGHNDDCRGCGASVLHYDDCPDSDCAACEEAWPCQITRGVCGCGNNWPCPDAVAPGSSYDTGPGACIASHAEANAVADAMQRNGGRLAGAVMYVSCEPCDGCVRHIRNTTDIEAVIWRGGVIALP